MASPAQERFDYLTDVLEYTRKYKPSHFSAGERICIHQERARLLVFLGNYMASDEEICSGRSYVVPNQIEAKMAEIKNWISITNKNRSNE